MASIVGLSVLAAAVVMLFTASAAQAQVIAAAAAAAAAVAGAFAAAAAWKAATASNDAAKRSTEALGRTLQPSIQASVYPSADDPTKAIGQIMDANGISRPTDVEIEWVLRDGRRLQDSVESLELWSSKRPPGSTIAHLMDLGPWRGSESETASAVRVRYHDEYRLLRWECLIHFRSGEPSKTWSVRLL